MSQISSVSSHEDETWDSGESALSHSRCSSSNSIPSAAVQIHEQNRAVSTSVETGWTDSKHSSYLNFMEANFVKNMFGSSYCSEDVCGKTSFHHQYADIEECDEDSAQSRLHNPYESMEFKMYDHGDWTWRPTLRPMVPGGIPWVLLKNPWVKHFRPKKTSTILSTLLSSRNDEVRSMVSSSPKVIGSTAEQLQRVNACDVITSSSNPGNENPKTKLAVCGRRNDNSEAGQTNQWIQKQSLNQTVDADVSNTKKRALWSTCKQLPITRQKIDNEMECSGQYGTNDQDDASPLNVIVGDSAPAELGNLVKES